MGLGETVALGFIAGVTILLGLPVGRLRTPRPVLKLFLTAAAIGVLLFLVWDVLSAAWEPIDSALAAAHDHTGGLAPAFGYGSLFAAGLAVGLLALVGYDRVLDRRRAAVRSPAAPTPPTAVGDPVVSPGATATAVATRPVTGLATWSPARRLALLIATGIGLHNFAEGLAIGKSAASNEVALATMLVIGFGLHNATEGFGIVAPLAGEVDDSGVPARPSWRLLLLFGAIAGGPTVLGTAVGHGFTSEPVSVVFLTLAAGSIIYVVVQLVGVLARARRPDVLCYGVLVGLLAGFLTDAIVTAAGA